MLFEANHEEHTGLMAGELVTVKRGEFVTSKVKLAKKWGWSETKLNNFLKLLEKDSMIKVDARRNKFTHITILNYRQYQDRQKQKKVQEADRKSTGEVQEADAQGTVSGRCEDDLTIKQLNNDNNETILPSASATGKSKSKKTLFDLNTSISREQYQEILGRPDLADGDRMYLLSNVESMKDWSHSKGEKRIDWAAVLRNWIKSERKRGHLPNSQRPNQPKTFKQMDRDDEEQERQRTLQKLQEIENEGKEVVIT